MEDPKIEVTSKDGERCIIVHLSKEFLGTITDVEDLTVDSITILANRHKMRGDCGIRTAEKMPWLHTYAHYGSPMYKRLIPVIKQWVEEYLYSTTPKSRFAAIMKELSNE